MKYRIYFVTNDYREELEVAELEAETEHDAAIEYLEGYKLNNAGQPDAILEQIAACDAWIEVERMEEV